MAGRPEPEIPEETEITPEMIEAGALVLAGFERAFDSLEDGARRIFAAMMGARNRA